MIKFRRRLEKGGDGIRFLICLAISVISILTTALIAALIVSRLDDPTSKLGLYSLLAMLVAAGLSGMITVKTGGDGDLRFSVLVSLAVVLLMLLINVIFCKGRVSGGAFMNYGCYFGVASLCAFIGRKKNKRPRHRF